MANKLHH